MAKPIVLPECAQKLLETLYPTVDWSRVIFLSGLPFWVQSGTSAITLPDPIDAWRFRIYLGSNTDFCDPDQISVLLHEAAHIGQFMSIANGYGPGFFRPAFISYFACHFAHGYKKNPFEVEADDYQARFDACYKNNAVCDCSKGEPVFDEAALKGLIACDESLVVRRPRAPHCPTLGWLAAIPVVLILGILVFIIHWFDRVHCHLVAQQFQQCVKWAQTTQTLCRQWATQTIQQCTQWADQGYSACDKWADEGYSKCDQWSTTSSSSCCTWWPCSWGCQALVWITTTICVLTIWVSNWVCKVWIWVANVVCVAFATIVQLVCILWTTIVQLVCLIWRTFWQLVLFCWI